MYLVAYLTALLAGFRREVQRHQPQLHTERAILPPAGTVHSSVRLITPHGKQTRLRRSTPPAGTPLRSRRATLRACCLLGTRRCSLTQAATPAATPACTSPSAPARAKALNIRWVLAVMRYAAVNDRELHRRHIYGQGPELSADMSLPARIAHYAMRLGQQLHPESGSSPVVPECCRWPCSDPRMPLPTCRPRMASFAHGSANMRDTSQQRSMSST